MPRGDHPEAYWDKDAQMCRDWDTGRELPNYEGLIFHGPPPMILNTRLENGERRWEYVTSGAYYNHATLDAIG
jgi:hypothetical protein